MTEKSLPKTKRYPTMLNIELLRYFFYLLGIRPRLDYHQQHGKSCIKKISVCVHFQ